MRAVPFGSSALVGRVEGTEYSRKGLRGCSKYSFFLAAQALLFMTAAWATNIHDTIVGDIEPIMGSKCAPATAPGLGSPLPHLHRDWPPPPHTHTLPSSTAPTYVPAVGTLAHRTSLPTVSTALADPLTHIYACVCV